MKTMKGLCALVALAPFALAISCDPLNPATTGAVTIGVNGTAPGTLAASVSGSSRSITPRGLGELTVPVEYPAGTAAGEITFTTLKLVLKEFEIEQEVADTNESSFEFAGPYVVDLVEQTVDPEPGVVDLPGGVYTELKFKIDTIEGDEDDEVGAQLVAGDDPLFGHSILMVGTFVPTVGSPVDFTYTYDLDAEFELKTTGEVAVGFDVTNGAQNSIIVAFRFHRWFDGIDPAAFAADPGAYAETLKDNIKASADYGKDDDDNGILTSDEDDDPDEEDLNDD